MRKILTLLLVTPVLTAPVFAGAGWEGLKAGLTRAAAAAAVGPPLVKNSARGYEDWFFDCQGEVMFCQGRVIYWNVPQTGTQTPANAIGTAGKGSPAPAAGSLAPPGRAPGQNPARAKPRA